MDELGLIINQLGDQSQEIQDSLNNTEYKIEALVRFRENQKLTDRQEQMVAEELKKRRFTLQKDLSKIENNVGMNMDMAAEIQETIDGIDREIKRLG